MAELNLNLKQTVSPKVTQKTILVGRVKMAQAIQMRESEWARLLSEMERDPLFQELLQAKLEGQRVIHYRKFQRGGLSGQFYEMQDLDVVDTGGQSPETLLDQKKHLLALIQKVGQPNFEKYFLFREEVALPEEIAGVCGISKEEVQQLQDFVLDMSVQAEFYHPSALDSTNQVRPTLIGQIIENRDKTYSMAFFSPHLARGTYEIDQSALHRWQKNRKFDRQESARVKKYVSFLQLSNLKQGAFWRVIDFLLEAQKGYLGTRDPARMASVSLRKVARHLQFAPSTISRVLSLKSVLLPWGSEVLLTHLMPGQRKVVLAVLSQMAAGKGLGTDQESAKHLAEVYGLRVSRRTITACRHVIQKPDAPVKSQAA